MRKCNNPVDFDRWQRLHGEPPNWRIDLMSEEKTSAILTGTPLGEISQPPSASEAFLDKHQMKVILLAVALCIAALVAVVYRGIKQSAEEEAGRQFVSAEATSELQGVVKNHKGTSAAHSAKILLAEEQWKDGLKDESVATLSAFIESDQSHPAFPSAQASLASKLRTQGETEKARELFNEIAENPAANHLAPFAWISLGDMAMDAGDADAAKTAYQTVEQDFPGSSYSSEARERLLLLKAEKPEEVAAPISLPDVNLTEDVDGSGEVASPQITDLLNPGGNGSDAEVETPLVPEEKPEAPSE